MKTLHRIFLFGALSTLCFFISCSDDDCAQETFYQDADGDGFGNAANPQTACTPPEGHVADNTDTDDTNANKFPGCTEVTYYQDSDGDGFGNPNVSETLCEGEDTPSGYVADKTDTDDTNAAIFPDCEQVTVYEDSDGDSFGNPDVSQTLCSGEDIPTGFVADDTDCDDANAEVNPNVMVTYYEDADSDGFGNPDVSQELSICADAPTGFVQLENTDCDDTDANINPLIAEVPNDGIDNNCSGRDTQIWNGPNTSFNKESFADWTQPENQDRLTDKVVFTRQNAGPMYNYQWWQDTFGEDAVHQNYDNSDLVADFWNESDSALKDFSQIDPSGGTKGVRWALLDATGANNPNAAWDNFELFGALGDPTHFYSFHNILAIIRNLENETLITGVFNDFELENGTSSADADVIVSKKLGVWLVEEDIYLTLVVTEWGSGGSGGAISYTRSTPNN